MEKRIALTGQYSGTAHLRAQTDPNTGSECTALRLIMRQALPKGCSAYLLSGTKLVRLPINGVAGSVEGTIMPDALLVAAGEELLSFGGFAGDRRRLERALEQMRIQALNESSLKTPSAQSPQSKNAEVQKASPQKNVAPADSVCNAPAKAQETAGKSSKGEVPPSPLFSASGESTALFDILQKAQMLFGPLHQMHSEPPTPPPKPLCPFPDAFPNTQWKKISYPGTTRCYLEATVQNEKGRFLLHAIPGEYAPVPPVPDFKRFLRSEDGAGYWLRIRKIR